MSANALLRLPRRLPLPYLVGVLSCLLPAPVPLAAQDGATVVFLVRHAEKVDDSADPPLSPAGLERARLLARTLSDAGITRILSSDYDRTRSTAAPLAERLGLPVELYDPRDLEAAAADIRANGGRVLVSGHSNTTPALVGLLGGEPGEPIREADEYDRLYVVTLGSRGAATALIRYGAAPPGP